MSTNPAQSIGQTGGLTWNITVNPTVQAAAYTSGLSIGGVQVINGAYKNNSGIIQSVIITDTAAQAAGMTIIFFNQQPTGPYPDRNTVTINTADKAKIVGAISVSSGTSGWTTINSLFSISTNCPIGLPSSASDLTSPIWALAIATGSSTFTANCLTFNYGILQD